MKPLLRTNNLALISFVEALLKDADIDYFIADQAISAVEGSIGLFPKRILVDDEDLNQARQIMIAADLGHELSSLR